jgi:hypothetical protein
MTLFCSLLSSCLGGCEEAVLGRAPFLFVKGIFVMHAPESSADDLGWGGKQERSDRLNVGNEAVTADIAEDSPSGFLSAQLDELDQELGEVHLGRSRPR